MYFPPEYAAFLNEPIETHDGLLKLVLTNKNNKTHTEERYTKNPLSISKPLYLTQHMAYFYLINTSGGLVQGDRLHIDITLNENCRANITTQSATKIYGMEKNCAVQYTSIEMRENSYLEYLPDPNIPYRDSRFFQISEIHLKKNSTLFFWDILYPGRFSRGEEFENDIYYSNLKIFLDNELSLIDTVVIAPKKQDPKNIGIMGNKKFAANLYLFSENYELFIRELQGYSYGINPAGMLVIRILEEEWLTAKRKLEEIWGKVRKTYANGEIIPTRKY